MFASNFNKQLPVYVSYTPDLDALSLHAFIVSWKNNVIIIIIIFPFQFDEQNDSESCRRNGQPGTFDSPFMANPSVVFAASTSNFSTELHFRPGSFDISLMANPSVIFAASTSNFRTVLHSTKRKQLSRTARRRFGPQTQWRPLRKTLTSGLGLDNMSLVWPAVVQLLVFIYSGIQ